MNYNRATIVGRLTRDPETRSLPSGQTVANFGLATNRVWTNQQSGEKQEAVDFHNVVAFGRLGEICGQYLNKGSLVLIEGRLQTRSWEGQDGVKHYRTEIVAQNMQMGPRSQGAAGTGPRPAPSTSQEPKTPTSPEEDIPVIDAEEETSKTEKPDENSPDKQEEGEIDVNNIPF